MKTNDELIIIGAGGHAKVVLSVAQLNGLKIKGYVDNNVLLTNKIINGYPVLSDSELLFSELTTAVIGVGNNLVRKKISNQYLCFQNWRTLIHPNAYVHHSVKLGKGCVVFAGAIIQPDVVIGDHCIVNTGATIDHDCELANYVHIGPGVHLAGSVKVGEGVFFGIGSVVIPQITINAWSLIGAGSVVINDIPSNKKVMGVPAKEKI